MNPIQIKSSRDTTYLAASVQLAELRLCFAQFTSTGFALLNLQNNAAHIMSPKNHT